MRKLNFDDDEEMSFNAYVTPRDAGKAKAAPDSSGNQGSTGYTDKHQEFTQISASKFLFREEDQSASNQHLILNFSNHRNFELTRTHQTQSRMVPSFQSIFDPAHEDREQRADRVSNEIEGVRLSNSLWA